MVSRYLVDALVIVGLVLGAAGVFYLSNGLLGGRIQGGLRRVVIALILAGVFAIVVPLVFPLLLGSFYVQSSVGQYIAGSAGVVLGAETGLGLGLLIGGPVPNSASLPMRQWEIVLVNLGLALLFAGIGIFLGFALPLLVSSLSPSLPPLPIFRLFRGDGGAWTSVILALNLSAILVGGAVARSVPRLSERQLQVIGIILTLLGIAPQFIQPVLDLLNIKVV